MKKYIFPLALLVSFPQASFSAVNTAGEVARIYPNGDRVNIQLKDDQSCNLNGKYYYFTLDTEVKKAWYALVLSAAATSKPITVSLTACPTDVDVEVRYIYQNF